MGLVQQLRKHFDNPLSLFMLSFFFLIKPLPNTYLAFNKISRCDTIHVQSHPLVIFAHTCAGRYSTDVLLLSFVIHFYES